MRALLTFLILAAATPLSACDVFQQFAFAQQVYAAPVVQQFAYAPQFAAVQQFGYAPQAFAFSAGYQQQFAVQQFAVRRRTFVNAPFVAVRGRGLVGNVLDGVFGPRVVVGRNAFRVRPRARIVVGF